eukprot:CAMPEP_0181234448 /NCGR_PEP_ID=MMETSP1096-20121128/36971_1 /TAXON_ID=156174 ORGANISM="Chrysochromulina ericina, Strain CCMP281" /NCGR_SAMPLE_ID=MMETSP1096 /ASSEMBLY_ACC=CAM_ASM_000453 /LENGTH=37 /DNA_ID= /DNA_START= /DNA_END= /DNA_ORIENTATION=
MLHRKLDQLAHEAGVRQHDRPAFEDKLHGGREGHATL